MKQYLLLLLIPFTNPPLSYRQLTWGDYRGVVPVGVDHDAVTCTNISIGPDSVYAIFLPDRSWTKTTDKVLLRHEQLHFAITRYWAERINQFRVYNAVEHEYSRNLPYYLDQWRAMQRQYDAETNHGTDTTAQKRWEELIKL